MIGVLIVTHGSIGEGLLEQARVIAGDLPVVEALGVKSDVPPDATRGRIAEAIGRLERGKGVLILTDMFGGTPSNVALSFLDEGGRLEVLSGVNLPMLLKLVTARTEEAGLAEVAADLKAAGRKNIALAREIMGTPGSLVAKAKA